MAAFLVANAKLKKKQIKLTQQTIAPYSINQEVEWRTEWTHLEQKRSQSSKSMTSNDKDGSMR